MIRRFIVMTLIVGMAAPAFAGGIRESASAAVGRVVKQQAAQQQAVSSAPHVRRGYLWPGAILFAGGMAVATYGFLHTTDGDYVEPSDASKLADTKVGIGGLAMAAGGGAIMLMGARKGPSSSVAPGARSIGFGKSVSW